MPLTDTHIRGLKAEAKAKKYFDGGGLFLFVPTNGSKLWRMAYRFGGKSKLLSFGEYPTVSLKDARERREEAKKLLAQGEDPAEHKRQLKQEKIASQDNSFKNVALEWNATHNAVFSEKYRQGITYRLEKYIFPSIGRVNIAKLEAPDILAIVKPIDDKGHAETARRLLQIIGCVFRYGIVTGRAKHNVAADLRGALATRKIVHRASLIEPEKVGQLLVDIENYQGYYPLVCALKIAPHVFTRPTELRRAEWDEIDFEAQEWRIPAERMKMRRQHIVPLSEYVLDVLEGLHAVSGKGKFLFPSIRSDADTISDVTMLNALRRMGYQKHEMSVHGFRSIASTLLNELGYNRDWIERQLAHGESDGVRAAYNYAEYLPERRKMMQEWSEYLLSLKERATPAGKLD